MTGPNASVLLIETEGDLVNVRRAVRDAAASLGFGVTDVTRIVTAASELARNVLLYARRGTVEWRHVLDHERVGLEIVFRDEGPGIADVEAAMSVGYTTSGGLGLGLPGTKRLMDDMELATEEGKGTTIVVRKWMRR